MNPGIVRTRFAQNVLPALASLALHAAVLCTALSSVGVAFRPPAVDPGEQTVFDARADAPLLGTAGPGDTAAIDVPPSDVPGGAAAVPAVHLDPPDGPAAPRFGLATDGPADRGLDPGRPAASPRGSGTMFDVPGGANARSVCYVLDPSGSMLNKMATLKDQLGRAVSALTPAQTFNLIAFYSSRADVFDRRAMVPATDANKARAADWLDCVVGIGETDALVGLRIAFQLRPEVIYLITDGDFMDNSAVLPETARLNAGGRVRVNTIAFVNKSDTDTEFLDLLAKIAARNGGTFRKVNEDDLYP